MSEPEDEAPVPHTVELTLGPGDVRHVDDASVEAFDAALARVGTGEVMHLVDPRRIQTFAAGGPPVWSVASVPVDGDTLFLTYGLSAAIEPAGAGAHFEMAIRVRGPSSPWPALFLRGLCRYMISSGRALEPGQYMPFPAAITRFAVDPAGAASMPATAMDAACFVVDPALPSIATAHGEVQVRRALGMHPDELELMELWSAEGFVEAVLAVNGTLTTDVDRPSYTQVPAVRDAVEAGSRREGSRFGYVAVPGVHWGEGDEGLFVVFPGGAHAARVARMVRARLPFDRHLLVHDTDPGNPLAVALEPSEEIRAEVDGPTLVLGLPPRHGLFGTLLDASDEGVRWDLR